jgi:hypothetical protein
MTYEVNFFTDQFLHYFVAASADTPLLDAQKAGSPAEKACPRLARKNRQIVERRITANHIDGNI